MFSAVAVFALLAFTLVMSQPLFFVFALGRVSLALSGPAYAELRQRINAAITKPLIAVYATTFVACLVLAGLALNAGAQRTAIAAGVAAILLVVDLALAAAKNVPLNAIMNAWEPGSLPADWSEKRGAWHRVFAVRQLVLCVADLSLVLGLVVGS